MNLNEILDIVQIMVSAAIVVANCLIIRNLNEISKLDEKRKKAKRDREFLDSIANVDVVAKELKKQHHIHI